MASIGLSPGCNCCDPFSDCPELEGLEVPTGLGTFTQAMFQQIVADVYPYSSSTQSSGSFTNTTELSEGEILRFVAPSGFDFASLTGTGGCVYVHDSDAAIYEVDIVVVETITSVSDNNPTIVTTNTFRYDAELILTADISYRTQDGVTGVFGNISVRTKQPADPTWSRAIKDNATPFTIDSNHLVMNDSNFPAFDGHIL